MPDGAPIMKVENTKSLGAEVCLVPGTYDDAHDKAVELQAETGMTFIHPYDDEQVIAGQGTIGLEILDQLPDLDAVIVPVGGGGLISGVAFAIKSLRPEVKVYGVQAEGAPSMYRSLHEHKYQTLKAVSTFADGIQVKTPGELTYQICEQYVDDIVTVSEDETAAAILSLMENQKLVAEGAGALAAGAAANPGIAEAVGEGPIQDAVRMAAMRCGLWVVAGSIPLKGKDATHYTQSSLVFDPEGNIAARYDRIHLFRLQNKTEFYDERIYIEPGKSPVTFRMTTWDGESFSVGLSLGFDLRFPELFRGLSQPDLIVLPATFTEMTGRAHWATLLAARAIENQCFVAAAAQGGHHACGRRTWGHSRIIDAWGGMVSELASGTGIVIGNIERSQLENVRSTLPALASRTIY